ncbi:MAG TPA: rhamnogalacturonan acetylesterase [Bryobacteraceae bacterium]|jgi:lysophospholipase L1-like esterase|nr:rhamnogalacturonan acetylesterase [Bryobacteraceae bacterium]
MRKALWVPNRRRLQFGAIAAAALLCGSVSLRAQTSVFIAGDSTAAEGNPDAIGWGKPFASFFDSSKANVVNAAIGGRSSRTFVTEGHWDHIVAAIKPGDYVLIQFGQNDGAPMNGPKLARGSLPGLGEEAQEIDNVITGQHETLHTFGWYMRKMIREAKAKDAFPILLSLTVRNIWTDGHVERGSGQYSDWSRDIAKSEGVAFIDLTNLVADQYEKTGVDAVKPFFPKDHTHTNAQGAEYNARYVIAGLKALHENGIIRLFSTSGCAIDVAPPEDVSAPKLSIPRSKSSPEFWKWLNLPEPADTHLPDLFLIGDSTVRNGRGDGSDGQWGWGDALTRYFDPMKVNVVNRAVGGTGARTFMTSGYWTKTLAMLKPGDIVVMQFGHNDNGQIGALPGTGEETQERPDPASGQNEIVHTFGWYLRSYIAAARSKGATPIVCTLVPRNIWENGRIAEPHGSHADWAREIASKEEVPLLDLNTVIAHRYDSLGQQAVRELFADGRVHTNRRGAEMNAECVMSGLRALPGDPLTVYLRPQPAVSW